MTVWGQSFRLFTAVTCGGDLPLSALATCASSVISSIYLPSWNGVHTNRYFGHISSIAKTLRLSSEFFCLFLLQEAFVPGGNRRKDCLYLACFSESRKQFPHNYSGLMERLLSFYESIIIRPPRSDDTTSLGPEKFSFKGSIKSQRHICTVSPSVLIELWLSLVFFFGIASLLRVDSFFILFASFWMATRFANASSSVCDS